MNNSDAGTCLPYHAILRWKNSAIAYQQPRQISNRGIAYPAFMQLRCQMTLLASRYLNMITKATDSDIKIDPGSVLSHT
jgi:hypothetical protein